MSRVIALLTLALVVAVVQAAVVGLTLVLGIMLLFYAVTRPRATFTLLAVLGLMALANARPTAFIFTVGAVALAMVAGGACRTSSQPLKLTHQRAPLLPDDPGG